MFRRVQGENTAKIRPEYFILIRLTKSPAPDLHAKPPCKRIHPKHQHAAFEKAGFIMIF